MACKVARERASNAPNAAARYLCATLSVSFPGILQVKIKLQTRHWSRGPLSGNCFAIQINVRFAPEDLYGAICVKTIRYGSSPCSAGLRHLLVPTCFSLGCCAQRRSRVGRRLIAERLALDGREHSGRLARSGCTPAPLATETIPRGARHRARRLRATNLYSADP
jgi:hypothetical protein